MLLSLSATFSVYCDLCLFCLSQQQRFFSSWTQSSVEFQVIICTVNILFSGLKMVRYHYFHKKTMYNFNLHYFMSSIESLNKCFSLQKNLCLYKSILYKFFSTNLSKVKLEILRNSSTIFRCSHQRNSMKKLWILQNFKEHLFGRTSANHCICIFGKCFPRTFLKWIFTS